MRLSSRYVALLTITCIAATGVSAYPGQEKLTCTNQTDSIGPFRLEYRMPLNEHQKIVSKMEEFVWSHWRSKRIGCLSFRFVTAEGARVDVSMFLEDDEKSAWRVRIERKEIRGNQGHPSSRSIVRSTRLSYSVRRVDGKRPIDDGYAPFPDSEDLRPGAYLMEFRDKEGQIVMRWEPDDTTR